MMQPNSTSPERSSQQPQTPGQKAMQFRGSVVMPLDIVGGTSFGRYPKISNESTYNMIVSDNALVPFAGYEFVVEIANGSQARAVYNAVIPNLIVAVVGNGFYTISDNFVVTRVGSLGSFSGNVYIADNLAGQIVVVDGSPTIYIFNYNTSSYQTITVDFSAVYITYQDTYFIASDGNTNQWRLSQPSDGTVWPPDAQHVGELQSKPCKSVAVVALDRILLVMGQTVTEPWYDAGLQLFPYARNNSYCIDYGTRSTQTIASGFGMIVWLATNQQSGYAIMVSQEGGPPQPISIDGLDYLFANFTAPQDSYGMLYKLEGHIIYQLTFTTDNYTFLYDFETQMFFNATDEKLNHHIARRVVFFNGTNYFISFKDGNLYRMSSSINTYNGESIPRIRIPKNIRFGMADRFIVQNINLTMESGVNKYGAIKLTPDSDVNDDFLGQNRIDMNLSNDGGYRWGYTWSKVLNNRGKFRTSVNFNKIGGLQDDLVIKFRFVSQGRFVVTGGTISLYR